MLVPWVLIVPTATPAGKEIDTAVFVKAVNMSGAVPVIMFDWYICAVTVAAAGITSPTSKLKVKDNLCNVAPTGALKAMFSNVNGAPVRSIVGGIPARMVTVLALFPNATTAPVASVPSSAEVRMTGRPEANGIKGVPVPGVPGIPCLPCAPV